MADSNYHLEELNIAQSQDDPRRAVPEIPTGCRRVLDIGCGAGQTLLAANLEGAQAFGIDVECSALQLGRKIGAPVLFTCASGEALPFAAESFDFLFSRVALPYMDVSKAAGEMARVLEPDGQIWMTLHPVSLPWRWALSHPKQTIYEIYRQLNTALLHFTGRQFRYPVRPAHIESYQTERGMRSVLERAGFTDIRFTRTRHFLCTARKRRLT